ncbi:hypothetical protein GCM10023155_07390 [Bremerella cremea]
MVCKENSESAVISRHTAEGGSATPAGSSRLHFHRQNLLRVEFTHYFQLGTVLAGKVEPCRFGSRVAGTFSKHWLLGGSAM